MDGGAVLEQQQQPLEPPPEPPQPQPILRKKRLNQDSNSASNHHVRIAPSPTSHDENENDDAVPEEPWTDRENPFRPGSDLDRQADSLLRNSRISRNSVHLAQSEAESKLKSDEELGQKPEQKPEEMADVTTATLDANLREDTVGLLTPSMAVAAVIADDAADSSGPDDEPELEEPLVASSSAPAAASAAPHPSSARQAEAPNGSASPKTKPPTKETEATASTEAGPVQTKGVGRACCDLM